MWCREQRCSVRRLPSYFRPRAKTVCSSKRFDRLVKINGNGLALKSETKPKRKNADSVAKAAEAKRRKIEGDTSDPAADDDDVKPVIPKIEPCADTLIKEEPNPASPFAGNSSSSFTYPGFHNYASTPIPYSPYCPSNYASLSNTLPRPSPPPWQRYNQLSLQEAPPIPSASGSSPAQSPSTASTHLLLGSLNKDPTSEQTLQDSELQTPKKDNLPQQAAFVVSQPDETVFSDFCSSDLFMPPLQRYSMAPPLSPLLPQSPRSSSTRSPERNEPTVVRERGSQDKTQSPRSTNNLALLSKPPFRSSQQLNDDTVQKSSYPDISTVQTSTNSLPRPSGAPTQPDCIVIDD